MGIANTYLIEIILGIQHHGGLNHSLPLMRYILGIPWAYNGYLNLDIHIYIYTYHIMGNTLEYHWYATSNMMWVWSSSNGNQRESVCKIPMTKD